VIGPLDRGQLDIRLQFDEHVVADVKCALGTLLIRQMLHVLPSVMQVMLQDLMY
jgi:hypothetical protein